MGTKPWNDWYHLTAHTYGTWLYGDRRGWRTRHHREQVEGDYRRPPQPGTFEAKLERSKRLMKRSPVYLWNIDARIAAVAAVVEKFIADQIEIVAASMTRDHLHVLVRCPDHEPREWMGRAKKHSSHILRERGLKPEGSLWGVRCKVDPVKDREHQLNVVGYIRDHRDEGGATWLVTQPDKVCPPRVK